MPFEKILDQSPYFPINQEQNGEPIENKFKRILDTFPCVPLNKVLKGLFDSQKVPLLKIRTSLNLLPYEMSFHLFQFLETDQIAKLGSVSTELRVPAKAYLDSFEGQLRTFYQLSDKNKTIDPNKKIIEGKKRKECFDLLLVHPKLKKHFEKETNREIFFNHLQEVDDYQNLFNDKLKIVQDLYFEFATDEKLKKFVDVVSLLFDNKGFLCGTKFIESLEKSHVKRLTNLLLNHRLDIGKFLDAFTFLPKREPPSLHFDVIYDFYQAKPDHQIWEMIIQNDHWLQLKPFVMTAYILREFTTSNHPNFNGLILLGGITLCKFDWKNCLEILVPRIELIEEKKQNILRNAISDLVNHQHL